MNSQFVQLVSFSRYTIMSEKKENKELKEALKAFLDMRKSIKKPIQTEYAFKLALNKLKQLSDIDSERIEIVNQSVEHNWQTFYALQNSYRTNEVEMPEYMKKQEKGYDA